MLETVKEILRAPGRVVLNFPYTKTKSTLPYFGDSELSDILSFGFSFVEHEDHCVEYLLVSPYTAKRIIKEIDALNLLVDEDFFGFLWTAKVVLTDKISDNRVVFANRDNSVVLDLNINKMEV